MRNLLFIIMTIGLFGCTSPKQEDFVGVWIGDSVKLEIKSDGSCIATGDNKYLLLGEDVKRYDVNTYLIGKWSLEDMYSTASYSLYNRKILRFMFVNKDSIDKFYIMMEIHKEPYNTYYIYMDLSDPDDMNRFKFEKQWYKEPYNIDKHPMMEIVVTSKNGIQESFNFYRTDNGYRLIEATFISKSYGDIN